MEKYNKRTDHSKYSIDIVYVYSVSSDTVECGRSTCSVFTTPFMQMFCTSGESTSACTAARAVGSRVRSSTGEKRKGGLPKVTSGVGALLTAVLYLPIPFRLLYV